MMMMMINATLAQAQRQTEAISATSPDCIFSEGTVIKPGRNQLGLICAVWPPGVRMCE